MARSYFRAKRGSRRPGRIKSLQAEADEQKSLRQDAARVIRNFFEKKMGEGSNGPRHQETKDE